MLFTYTLGILSACAAIGFAQEPDQIPGKCVTPSNQTSNCGQTGTLKRPFIIKNGSAIPVANTLECAQRCFGKTEGRPCVAFGYVSQQSNGLCNLYGKTLTAMRFKRSKPNPQGEQYFSQSCYTIYSFPDSIITDGTFAQNPVPECAPVTSSDSHPDRSGCWYEDVYRGNVNLHHFQAFSKSAANTPYDAAIYEANDGSMILDQAFQTCPMTIYKLSYFARNSPFYERLANFYGHLDSYYFEEPFGKPNIIYFYTGATSALFGFEASNFDPGNLQGTGQSIGDVEITPIYESQVPEGSKIVNI